MMKSFLCTLTLVGGGLAVSMMGCGAKDPNDQPQAKTPDYTTCPAGALTPKRMGLTSKVPRHLVSDGSHVFFTTEQVPATAGNDNLVVRVPLAGGSADVVYRSRDFVGLNRSPLVLQGSELYFVEDLSVMKLPTSEGALATSTSVRPTMTFDVDADWIYFSDDGSDLYRADKTGGARTKLWTADGHIADVQLDGDHLYVQSDRSTSAIFRLPKSGGEATQVASLPTDLAIGSLAHEHDQWVATKLGLEGPPLCHDGSVADGGADGGGGTSVGGFCANGSIPSQDRFVSVYATTTSGTPKLLAHELDARDSFDDEPVALVGGVVYYGLDHTLQKVPLDGGTPQTMATFDGPLQAITVDGADAYVLSGGCLYREPK